MKRVKKRLAIFFVPREENNYRAKVLHPAFLSLIVGAFLFTQSLISFLSLTKPGVLGYASDITPEKVVELTNVQREKSGLKPLKTNAVLSQAAQAKAADMFAFDYWAHVSPSGRTPWSFFKNEGYSYTVAGENLAKDFASSDGVVKAWMNSPTHRENILNDRFKEIGVAVVNGNLNGVGTTLVVQFFGTPTMAVAPLPETTKTVGAASLNSVKAVLGPTNSRVSPLAVTKTVSAFFFGLLMGALVVDALVISRRKVYRMSGKSIAHASLLVVIFLFIMISRQGGIK